MSPASQPGNEAHRIHRNDPRRRGRGLAAAALLTVTGLALAGCSSSTADAADAEPQAGGELVVGVQSVTQLDPQQGGNNDGVAVQRQLVASLTISDPNAPGTVQPWIAESWTVSDDSTEFLFDLRDDAVFADGTPIDAESVKANFDALIALGAEAAGANQLLLGAETTVVSSDEVKVAFPSPNLQFLEATSTSVLGLISTESTKLSIEDRKAGKFVGSGPFQLESYTPEQEVVLVKVPGYNLGTSVDANTGEAYLDRITFTQIDEGSVRAGSLTSGDVQVATFLTTPELNNFAQTPGFHVISRTNPGTVFGLNPKLERDTPLRELAVRQAIQAAIDRAQVAQIAYGDEALPAQSLLAETTPLFTDLSDLLVRDVDRANTLLDGAGWVKGADGVRERDGTRLEFNVTFWQASDPLVVVQEQLAEIGIKLDVVQVSVSEATARADQSDFQYSNVSRNEPDRLRNDFLARLETWKTANLDTTQNPDLDTIENQLVEQVGIQDPEERKGVLAEAQTSIIENGYSFPVYTLISSIAVSDTVHDLRLDGTSRLSFYNTWVEA